MDWIDKSLWKLGSSVPTKATTIESVMNNAITTKTIASLLSGFNPIMGMTSDNAGMPFRAFNLSGSRGTIMCLCGRADNLTPVSLA